MLSEKVVREAFQAINVAAFRANKANPDHPNTAAYTGMLSVLAWVLEDPTHGDVFNAILTETSKMVGNKVTTSRS